MKATIRDADAIGALRPLNVVGYLRAHGWQKFSESAGKFSVWVHPSHPEAEIVVPLKREAGDFVTQLADDLRELEVVEARSQFDILRDLLNSGFDVVRLGAKSPGTNDGTVKIKDGVKLFEQAREILLSAACATVRPRSVFHARKPLQSGGRVTIFARVEDAMRKAAVELTESDYNLATQAHLEYRSVKVIGNIRREGHSYRIDTPIGFDFATDDDEPS